jgi:hypothetical protein
MPSTGIRGALFARWRVVRTGLFAKLTEDALGRRSASIKRVRDALRER